jgi:hypothetical protein
MKFATPDDAAFVMSSGVHVAGPARSIPRLRYASLGMTSR